MPLSPSPLVALVSGVLLTGPTGAGCSRDSHADTGVATAIASSSGKDLAAAAPRANCEHAACGNNYFVDAAEPAACSADASCTLALTLVATGAYHINDEYPYKFRADDGAGLQFLGKSDAGRNVFSKASDDWTKRDEKTGTMKVTFRPAAAGRKVVAGLFKLSVCSPQSCQLEQQAIQTSVTVR